MDHFASQAFFDGWEGIIKILISAPVIYLSIILIVRVSGKRSTSQMNNFDWIVTVAIGSISASGVIFDSVSIVECLLAIGLLLLFQGLLTKTIMHSKTVHKMVKARPTLLVHNGDYLEDALIGERVTKEEVLAALRENGLHTVEDAKWVILENDASLSVIPMKDRDYSDAQLDSVIGFPPKVKQG